VTPGVLPAPLRERRVFEVDTDRTASMRSTAAAVRPFFSLACFFGGTGRLATPEPRGTNLSSAVPQCVR
jgi:hypothetical protein